MAAMNMTVAQRALVKARALATAVLEATDALGIETTRRKRKRKATAAAPPAPKKAGAKRARGSVADAPEE